MITFFFKYKNIGGVQVLIFNLMKELFAHNIITKLIYYQDSWLTKELDQYCIDYEFLNIENVSTSTINSFVSKKDVLVTTNLFMDLTYFRDSNPFFFFWNVFYNDLDYHKSNFIAIRNFTRRELLKKMIKKKGLVFMDNGGVQYIEKHFKLRFTPVFLPVPIPIQNNNEFLARRSISRTGNINITYLGRSINRKIKPFNKVIRDIENDNKFNKLVIIHVITDNVEEFKRLCNVQSSNVKIRFYSNLSGVELKDFLRISSDLHIAMGTSCLEGSSLGIPSILLNPCNGELPDNYLYKWIFEVESYSLGEIFEGNNKKMFGLTFSQILSYYEEKKCIILKEISQKCFEYTNQNHNIHKIALDFNNSCMRSKLKIKDVLLTDLSYYLKRLVRNI